MSNNSEYLRVLAEGGDTSNLPEPNSVNGAYLYHICKNGMANVNKDIDILYKLNEGITYEFEEQTETGTNAAPSGAKYESILSVDGNTKQNKWNGYNVVDSMYCGAVITDTNGIVTVNNDNITVEVLNDLLPYETFAFIPLNLENGNYTFASNVDTWNDTIEVYGQTIINYNDGSPNKNYYENGKIFTVDDSVSKVILRVQSGGQGAKKGTYKIHFMIEKGSTAHNYEPYVGGIPSPSPEYPQDIVGVTELNITVGEETRKIIPPTPLYKIGDYVDKLDVENGVWEYNTGKLVLKGNEWVKSSTKNNSFIFYLKEQTYGKQYIFVSSMCSDKLKFVNCDSMSATYSKGNGTVGLNIIENNIYIRFDNCSTLEEFKTYIGECDIYVPYADGYSKTTPISVNDLTWLRNLDGTSTDEVITITDQNGNDVSYLVEYIVKLAREVATNE